MFSGYRGILSGEKTPVMWSWLLTYV